MITTGFPPPNSPLRILIGCAFFSLVLHAGVVAGLSLFPHTQPMQAEVPMVHITLVAMQPTKGSKPLISPHPPFKMARPTKRTLPASQHKTLVLAGAMLQTFTAFVEPLTRQPLLHARSTHSVKRVLNNHQAVNALLAGSFLKMANFPSSLFPKGHTSTTVSTLNDLSIPQASTIGLQTSPIGPQSDDPIPSVPRPHTILRADLPNPSDHSGSNVGLLYTNQPVYPHIARESGWEGTVIVRVVIQPDGRTGDVLVRKSSGYPLLDEAAVEAVHTWRFTPARDGHIPIRSLVDIPINFDLKRLG